MDAPSSYHLQFPAGFLEATRPRGLGPASHPTFSLSGPESLHRFGGSADGACSVCAGALHHMLTLQAVPEDLSVTSRASLQLVTCLSCLGWSEEELFFSHDAAGVPRALPALPTDPEFPAAPLRETTVRLAPTPAPWRSQDWALSNGRENLHRLGGAPTWVQAAQHPHCPGCGRPMSSLLQLDSNLPSEDGSGWLWGSGCLGYFFWCDACAISGSLWQCT